MPLIRYRTNEDKIQEVMVDNNITVSCFLDMINKKSNNKFTKSVFKGRILDDNDLIRNHITSSDHVLILLSNEIDESINVMDLEEIKENTNIKKVENIVSSSFLHRAEKNQKRKGFLYTFTIYTTATSDSMLHGNEMEFSLNDDYLKIYDEIKKLVSKFPQINYDFEIHLFLPGGIYFKSGTLLEYYSSAGNITYDNIYAVITTTNNLYKIKSQINNPCSCSEPERIQMLSPLCISSSSAGLSQIASFLGYMYYGGPKSEQILLSLAKITRFAPLVVNLYRLIENRPITALNIISITSSLYTLFRSMLPAEIKNENVFEYTLNFLSVFEVITNNEYLKFFELNMNEKKERKEMKQLSHYCKKTKQQHNVIIWTADTINPYFESVIMKPEFKTIENIFSTVTSFKSVSPLSLHYIFYPSFVRSGNDEKSVMLFIKQIHEKENFVSLIDPFEGIQKEIKIEELAKQLNYNKDDDYQIDPNQIDQIIFVLLDDSESMKNEFDCIEKKSRESVSSEFLKEFVKKSHLFRVSSLMGLITFGSEVKIRQKLTAIKSDFVQCLEKIDPKGKSHLYEAISIAQQEICSFIKGKDEKTRFPNSMLRIIVITDNSNDNSEKIPDTLIKNLISNDIVVDTVLIGKNSESNCRAISKLTGGLCFKPTNFENGMEIFEQEAFLNIKTRHMKSLGQISTEIIDNDEYDSYAPNQKIINARSKVSLATPKYMTYVSMQKVFKTYRMMRSFTELSTISRNENDSFVVYSLFATPEEWRIFIKGPKNTPFDNKWLNLYMILPENYPTAPPQFRFLTIPFHPNVSPEGTVIFSLNDKDYTSSLGIDFIITGIIELLENPDKNYPINRKAMELFMNDVSEFKKQQEKIGETGLIDYHEFLNDVKIYDQIPEDFVLPNEKLRKSNLISLTSESVKEAVLKGGQINDDCLLDINDYNIIEELGSGSYGDVYLVVEKTTEHEFAAKIQSHDEDFEDDGEPIDYIKEVNVLSIFNHGAITKLYGYCLKDFDDNDRRVIIMEYVPNGNLQEIIDDEFNKIPRNGWDNTQKLITLYGIAAGMAYSVSYGITHSDLKPDNILMTNDLYPKITDFDSARLAVENNEQSFNMSSHNISTPIYTAPEIVSEKDYKKYAEKSDVYSYSIILYQVMTTKTPFIWYKSPMKLFKDIVAGKRPEIPSTVPPQYIDLMKNCWHKDPNKRPTFKEIADKFNSEEFLNDESIDQIRFQKYIEYIKNYKVKESEFTRPKSQTDKIKKKKNENKGREEVDEILKQSNGINILDLNEYEQLEAIGRGSYSVNYMIKNKKTGQLFAAKVSLVDLKIPFPKFSNKFLMEADIMSKINYPSIIKFVGFNPVDFNGAIKPTIVTEYLPNGSLSFITKKKPVPKQWNPTKRLITIFGIVAGMSYLHEHSILHNDLKPSNVLLDNKLYPKITDFGLSHIMKDLNDESLDGSKVKGTPMYIAPEVLENQTYSYSSDVYSFAFLLYEIIYMENPYVNTTTMKIFYDATKNIRPKLPTGADSDIFNPLIERCWARNPKERPAFKQLMIELQDKKYITNGVDQNEYYEYVKSLINFKTEK